MKQKGISFDELNKLQAKSKAKAKPRFTAEQERSYALEALAELSGLTQAQRGRVLRRAVKINEV